MSNVNQPMTSQTAIRFGCLLVALVSLPLLFYPLHARADPQDDRTDDLPIAPEPRSTSSRGRVMVQPSVSTFDTLDPRTQTPMRSSRANEDFFAQTIQRPVTEQRIRRVPVQVEQVYTDPNTGAVQRKSATTYRNETYNVTRYVNETNYVEVPHAERVRELAAQIADAGKDLSEEAEQEVAQQRQELKKLLGEQFDVMHQEQQKQIDQLAKRLKRLQELQKNREEAKDTIVQRRIQTLTRQPDPYAWSPTSTNQPPMSGVYRLPYSVTPLGQAGAPRLPNARQPHYAPQSQLANPGVRPNATPQVVPELNRSSTPNPLEPERLESHRDRGDSSDENPTTEPRDRVDRRGEDLFGN